MGKAGSWLAGPLSELRISAALEQVRHPQGGGWKEVDLWPLPAMQAMGVPCHREASGTQAVAPVMWMGRRQKSVAPRLDGRR